MLLSQPTHLLAIGLALLASFPAVAHAAHVGSRPQARASTSGVSYPCDQVHYSYTCPSGYSSSNDPTKSDNTECKGDPDGPTKDRFCSYSHAGGYREPHRDMSLKCPKRATLTTTCQDGKYVCQNPRDGDPNQGGGVVCDNES